ncbi:DUF3450 domain-containing protein [Echinimonas agarilytica]|uniref:DUF3450 domain-containing protein n=1 Tax=Echinimonas agarilytica TaxID=1215918 RepID=A0AA42B7U8_9GAMM|nr:DUF3450 domain-containing protein [Echinimonas agarilytica]MCM2680227.1 DUF3450 domain-containing protein [Echinimonas agarilytica]
MFFRKPLSLALLASVSLAFNATAIEDSLDKQQAIDTSAAVSQSRIDSMVEQTTSDLQSYRIASQRLESLTIYNQQMAKLITSQEQEISSISSQISEIDNIETGALPLMLKMTDTLGQLLEADVPFLKEERQDRLANLQSLIDRADVTAGEKYRRIMEAYQVEMEYGRTIEAYRGVLLKGDTPRTVDFLRLGRVGLYYQTLDGSESGRWSNHLKQWELLDSTYRTSIRDGLRIARKQTPPELLTLPVSSPAS